MTDNLTALGVQMLNGEQPARRPDFEGQNIESVRYDLAKNIRKTVETLNRQMKDAHTAGLTVALNSCSMVNPDAANVAIVSIFEHRRY